MNYISPKAFPKNLQIIMPMEISRKLYLHFLEISEMLLYIVSHNQSNWISWLLFSSMNFSMGFRVILLWNFSKNSFAIFSIGSSQNSAKTLFRIPKRLQSLFQNVQYLVICQTSASSVGNLNSTTIDMRLRQKWLQEFY